MSLFFVSCSSLVSTLYDLEYYIYSDTRDRQIIIKNHIKKNSLNFATVAKPSRRVYLYLPTSKKYSPVVPGQFVRYSKILA